MDGQPIESEKIKPILPDTLFKLLTRREVEDTKLRLADSEIQHVTRTDLVIKVPEGIDTAGTIFDFCAPTTVLEFKSENDPFGIREFTANYTRTAILFLQSKEEDYSLFLNAYVVARYPKEFLDNAPANGILFTVDEKQPWLRRAIVGGQRIVLIVCRDLPIERRFYRWLLFAPSDGKKWKEFVRRLKTEDEEELLGLAKQLRPQEFNTVKLDAKEIWEEVRKEGALTPEVEARLARERAKGVEILLSDLENKDYYQMKFSVDDMTDEQLSYMVNTLHPFRLVGLMDYLKPYQIERIMPLIKSEKKRQSIQNLLDEQANPSAQA